jgi:protease-4
MGSETVVRQLESAFRRRDVKAVVLRVESPGGSANASDLIHHATLELSRETRKPFVVSMGNVAASGGYHIACGANAIFAGRASRTGSIGVVFVKPSLEGFYARHNVRQDVFQRGAWMGGVSGNADWTPQMQASADSSVARSYEKFLAKVAAGRKLTRDQVHEVAQGRVWLGEDARARGLIDRIGGLDEAILEARRLARIPEAERLGLAEYRRPRPAIFERVLASAIRDAVTRAIRDPGRWGPAYLADSPLLDE